MKRVTVPGIQGGCRSDKYREEEILLWLAALEDCRLVATVDVTAGQMLGVEREGY